MSTSITPTLSPAVQYVLRLADTCLIQGQRLGEWTGHAPVLEEDIALANIALDQIGQARALLTLAGQLEARDGGTAHDEDQLAFLREERHYFNPILVELPHALTSDAAALGRRDFGVTVVRNLMVATLQQLLWQKLLTSSEPELAAIAGKALKEARYHHQHAADWLIRLGDGTDESQRRVQAALDELWRQVPELFAPDAVDDAAAASGLGPRWADLAEAWQAGMAAVIAEATLQLPQPGRHVGSGRQGRHTEHMGHLLAVMQHLQRAYPGGAW